jgi:hypothetical protein
LNDQTDQPLSGQQIQAIGAKASAALQQAVDRIDLRQKCLEYAIRSNAQPSEVIKLAQAMLAFLLCEAHEVRVKIDPPG